MIISFCVVKAVAGSAVPPISSFTGIQVPFNLFEALLAFLVVPQFKHRRHDPTNMISRILLNFLGLTRGEWKPNCKIKIYSSTATRELFRFISLAIGAFALRHTVEQECDTRWKRQPNSSTAAANNKIIYCYAVCLPKRYVLKKYFHGIATMGKMTKIKTRAMPSAGEPAR